MGQDGGQPLDSLLLVKLEKACPGGHAQVHAPPVPAACSVAAGSGHNPIMTFKPATPLHFLTNGKAHLHVHLWLQRLVQGRQPRQLSEPQVQLSQGVAVGGNAPEGGAPRCGLPVGKERG